MHRYLLDVENPLTYEVFDVMLISDESLLHKAAKGMKGQYKKKMRGH